MLHSPKSGTHPRTASAAERRTHRWRMGQGWSSCSARLRSRRSALHRDGTDCCSFRDRVRRRAEGCWFCSRTAATPGRPIIETIQPQHASAVAVLNVVAIERMRRPVVCQRLARGIDDRAADILTARIADATFVQGADHHRTELPSCDFDVQVQISSGSEQVVAGERPAAELGNGWLFRRVGIVLYGIAWLRVPRQSVVEPRIAGELPLIGTGVE